MNDCCPTCGAATREYRHRLSRPLVEALGAAFRAHDRRSFNPSHGLGLTHPQLSNWQKLRYWGLVSSEGSSGVWSVTERGMLFLLGLECVPAVAWTYRGEPLAREADLITIDSVVAGWTERSEWAQLAVAHNGSPQLGLFS